MIGVILRPLLAIATLCIGLQGTAIAATHTPACESLSAEARRLGGDGFLPSWPEAHVPALVNVAFTYDNALAAIALHGCGAPELARRIGATLLYVQRHDRNGRDGRLRNAYVAGPLGATSARPGGWWDPGQQRWYEDVYQSGSDSGNLGWTLLALVALSDEGTRRDYVQAAVQLGSWLVTQFDVRGATGFGGGLHGGGPHPAPAGWKSTEHNADLVAAFTQLARLTRDARWNRAAAQARSFVEAMWSTSCGCFAVGTLQDGRTPAPLRALDAQVLPLLALPGAATRYARALDMIEMKLRASGGGFRYSDAPGAMWTEGTAQTALLYRLLGRDTAANALMRSIEAQRDPRGRYLAAGPGGTGTGIGREDAPSIQRRYEREPHLAALAWAALAERGYNPYTLAEKLP